MANPSKGSLPDPNVIKSHLHKLSNAANALNGLSDGLTKVITQLESRLNEFNLGVEGVTEIVSWASENDESEKWLLAYRKNNTSKKWGFQIHRVEETRFGEERWTSWAFKDAPRAERVRAVEKIPDLLAALEKAANGMASSLAAQISYAQSLVLNFSTDASEKASEGREHD